MALKVQRGAQTTDQKREREREGGEAQSSEEKARVSSARFFLFFFGWVMGGVYLGYLCACRPTHTCAHVDQHIRHLKHPANLKSELSKHHLEPGP